MYGLADLKKINERAAEKATEQYSGAYYAKGDTVFKSPERNPETRGISMGFIVCTVAPSLLGSYGRSAAQEIADALNLADAVAEANANAVGRS